MNTISSLRQNFKTFVQYFVFVKLKQKDCFDSNEVN